MIRSFPRSFGLVAMGAVLIAAAVSSVSASAAPIVRAGASTSGLSYVALGDSYAAGYGLTPLTGADQSSPLCGQSSVDYPHLVATALGLKLADVTCASATTTDVSTARGDLPAQIAALSASTNVVSITIGGNDMNFASTMQTCAAASADGPLFVSSSVPNCATYFAMNPSAAPQTVLTNVVNPALVAAFAAVRADAPNAKVFVVGYPAIFPANIPTAGCFTAASTVNSFPFTTTDIAYLHAAEVGLNASVKTIAESSGFTYVPAYTDATDHSACASGSSAYVNGITMTGPTTVSASSLHPNTAGVASYATQLSAAISSAFPAQTTTAPTVPGAPFASDSGLTTANRGTLSETQSGRLVTISMPGSNPTDVVYIYGYSSPTYLGSHTVNSSRQVTVDTASLPGGQHHLVAVSATGSVLGWIAVSLAQTGAQESSTVLIALVLVIAGVGLTAVAMLRRKRRVNAPVL